MKQKAKESFLRVLTKTCQEEGIEINLHELSDKELKALYLKHQELRQGGFPYGISKEKDFEEAMKAGELQLVTFTDTYKYGVRRLTFKEYLKLIDFTAEHPTMYTALNGWRSR